MTRNQMNHFCLQYVTRDDLNDFEHLPSIYDAKPKDNCYWFMILIASNCASQCWYGFMIQSWRMPLNDFEDLPSIFDAKPKIQIAPGLWYWLLLIVHLSFVGACSLACMSCVMCWLAL